MSTRAEILRLLADGVFHSGTELGERLDVTRAAVCKNIHQLARAGLDIHRVTGRGYKLDTPLTLLDANGIHRFLGNSPEIRGRVHVLDEVDSTNRYLADFVGESSDINGVACLAEVQSGGRGRRGRAWIATPYCNLMLSMAWRFAGGPGTLSGLSLAAGVALLRALEEYGVAGAGLKWPNDILWDHRKLAGLLIDIKGEAAGPTLVILGLGINGHIGPRDAEDIDQPWTDLQTITGKLTDRNRLAALVIRHLSRMFRLFAEKGLAPFRPDWRKHHLFQGRRVRLLRGEQVVSGIVEDIDEAGGLILRQGRSRQVFHSGEVSLRPAPA